MWAGSAWFGDEEDLARDFVISPDMLDSRAANPIQILTQII